MIQLRKKRQRFAWLLLCVFVPMLLLASVHIHRQEAGSVVECYSCLHHLHHDGHLTSTSLTTDNCVLCHFLTTPYVALAVIAVFFIAIKIRVKNNMFVSRIKAVSHDAASLRAPPVCL